MLKQMASAFLTRSQLPLLAVIWHNHKVHVWAVCRSCLYASHDSLRPPPSLVAPDAKLSLSIPSLLSSSLPFFPFCLIPFLSVSFTFFSQLPLFFCFVFFVLSWHSTTGGWSSKTSTSEILPAPGVLPILSPLRPSPALRQQCLAAQYGLPFRHPPGRLQGQRRISQQKGTSGRRQHFENKESYFHCFYFHYRYFNVDNISLSFINLNTSLSFHFTISLYIISVCFTSFCRLLLYLKPNAITI